MNHMATCHRLSQETLITQQWAVAVFNNHNNPNGQNAVQLSISQPARVGLIHSSAL